MKKITLLVVEDEIDIRHMIRFSFPAAEFELIDAESVKQAIQALSETTPDLILLDWMLPDQSGIEFIQWIKKQAAFKNLPIIMLTAKAEEENKIKGLTVGADDYVVKPFSPKELIARIKTVLRRGVIVSPEHNIKHQALTLNTENSQVTIAGEMLSLTPIEYKLLHLLMKHPNKTFHRDQLISLVWGASTYIDDRTVDVHIRRLRDKLKQHNYDHIIKTIRGTGYQFNSDDR
jgi:two-component system, OmpR family, phosphate regulon response regulator PhoB